MIAASLTRLARSAPEKPGVRLASTSSCDVLVQRLALRVHLEDGDAALDVRRVDDDLAVEAAGPQQRRVEDVGAVRRRDDDDVGVRVEAVHLDEDLVQRLLALVVAAAEAGAALAADRVDLVDEDDAGRVALRLVEQVAHARGADADEHLDELGAADREEGHAGLAGDGAGEQRLAGTGRADQQDAARDAGAQRDELLRVLEELDDLLQLFLRFIHAGDVDEGHGGLVGREHARAALAEAHRLGVGALRLAHHEEDQADEDQDRQELQQQAQPIAELARLLDLDRDFGRVDAVIAEDGEDAGAVFLAGGVDRLVGLGDLEGVALDLDLLDRARLGVGDDAG